MSKIILTQIPAQSTLEFYIIITSVSLLPSIILSTVKFINESSKSIFQLVPFNWKQINLT